MKIFFFALVMALPSFAAAQNTSIDDRQTDLLGQGTLNVGVGIRGGYGNYRGTTGGVVPRLQYFLKDGWSVALEGRYEKYGNAFQYLGAGLSSRYYFVRDRRLALFGQVGLTYGQTNYRTYAYDPTNPSSIYQSFGKYGGAVQGSVGLGVHYRIASRWSIEAIAERTLTNTVGFTNYSRWQGNIGINFRLKK